MAFEVYLNSRIFVIEQQIKVLKNYAGGAEVELTKLQIELMELKRQLAYLKAGEEPFRKLP